ncbi:MAG: hypothetical protein KatS3mg083_273 [Candidatus Dojkabacteria bacterium]|nr:MAG: hypothetical protein KatS3mg083_273 [Candidatus Dojkabacteria bacterium]
MAEHFSYIYFVLAEKYIYAFLAKAGNLDKLIELIRSEDGATYIYEFVDSISEDELLKLIEISRDESESIPTGKLTLNTLYTIASDIVYGSSDLRVSFFGDRVVTKQASTLYKEAVSFLQNGLSAYRDFLIALLRYLTCNLLIRFSTYLYGRYNLYKKENFQAKYKSTMKRKKLHKLLMQQSPRYKAMFLTLRNYVRPRVYGDVLELWGMLYRKAKQDPKAEDARMDIIKKYLNGNDDIRVFIDQQKEYVTNKLKRYGNKGESKEE